MMIAMVSISNWNLAVEKHSKTLFIICKRIEIEINAKQIFILTPLIQSIR